MNNWIGQTVKHVWNNILACAKLRFGFLHKHNSFPLGPEQPWCPTSKELHVHSQLTCDRLVDDECGKVEPDLANVGRAGTNTYPENQFGAHQSGKWWPLLLRGHQMQEIWHSLNFVKMTHSIFEKAPSKGSLRVKCPISGIWYYEAHTLKCDAEHTETLYR